jgi:hypothetical protein
MSMPSLHNGSIKSVSFTIALLALFVYLVPLFLPCLHVPVYDNLDSNVVWYKILAHSGQIFAPNSTVIPNMMNGIPRASYGSELDLLLWLYYFFDAKTAFIINETSIHIIAFIGSWLLSVYVLAKEPDHIKYPIAATVTLYFATLPFWSGAGASIASLPLTAYVLLRIRNKEDNVRHWLYLLFIPFYSSFILVYMFFIIASGCYWLYLFITKHPARKRFFIAVALLTILFLLKNYRLIDTMFIHPVFTSHRVEFNVYFAETLKKAYELAVIKFLEGNALHADTLQFPYILPLAFIALLLGMSHFKTTHRTAAIFWILFGIALVTDVPGPLLAHRYIVPIVFLFALFAFIKHKDSRRIGGWFLLIILVDMFAIIFQYQGFKELTTIIPLFKSLNLIRIYFIQPLFFIFLLIETWRLYFHRFAYTRYALIAFAIAQFSYAVQYSYYQCRSFENRLSFDEYYAPKLYANIKDDLKKRFPNKTLRNIRVVHYGLEPAVSLYNGLYTVDGYSVNYPLSYKHRFEKVFAPLFKVPVLKASLDLYRDWGSKVYLLGINSSPEYYRIFLDANRSVPSTGFNADVTALCELHTDVVISAYPIRMAEKRHLQLFAHYQGSFWKLWLYELVCKNDKK